MKEERIVYLLKVFTSGKASKAEENELMSWVLEAENDESIRNFMLEIWNQQFSAGDYSNVDWEEVYARIMFLADIRMPKTTEKLKRFIWTAAASILVVISIAYFYFNSDRQEEVVTVQPMKKDVAPPSEDRAVLILADGTRIEMDSASNGMIAVQGNIKVIRRDDGTIAYAGSAAETISYNTVNVPRGSKPLSLMLADGSKVWVNVGSSLTFPTAFVGKEREVTMEGEVYFEVAHSAAMPFKVKRGDVVVKVLGTHFNVNAYKDEQAEKITLLEGSVVVNRKSESKALKPGQQAWVPAEPAENIAVRRNIDLDEVMAWRDGKFVFNQNMDIQDIMRQLVRWYDVEVEYKGTITQRFWGTISKDVNLSQVLKILEATGGVKFEIEGDRVIVLPAE